MLSELSDIDHVIECPDVYMGASSDVTENVLQYNPETNKLYKEELTYNRGILKMFDEILLNAVDNIERNNGLKMICVSVNSRQISVKNDGESKELTINKTKTKLGDTIWIPELAFTRLRTSGNYTVKNKLTGGKNGIGCKLTSIFSSEFIVELVSKHQKYYQTYTNNIKNINPPTISKTNEESYIKISFSPDFRLLKTNESILWDMRFLIAKRLFDISHLNINLNIMFNDEIFEIPHNSWDEFTALHNIMFSDKIKDNIQFYNIEGNWKVGFSISDTFKQVSYVNNIVTYDGGTHVNMIVNQLCDVISSRISSQTKGRKKGSKTTVKSVSNAKIKNKLCVIIYSKIVNPEFKSQTKEYLATPAKNFKFDIPIDLINLFIDETPIIDMIMNDKIPKTKVTRGLITNIPNLIEANKAGVKNGKQCTLFVCEGMSARTMCVRGINVIGPDYYGVYPLRGKILNVRNCSRDVYLKNEILTELKRVIGITDGEEYETVNGLRYGKVVCVKDADTDGANIMGLLINFFDVKFPSLLNIEGFFSTFMSPMIRIKGRHNVISFYNEVDYKNYIANNQIQQGMKVIFIKGLATNEDDDIEDMFKHYNKNTVPIQFDNNELLTHTFDKDYVITRKELLKTITDETHLDVVEDEPILLSNFITLDHSLYERDACERAIPSVIDGLKPTQRKVLFVLLKHERKQMKVFQVAGIVAQKANYHHGDQSMCQTIIKMAQDFTGANNINYLLPIGQFGSRLMNGDDAGAPRYISTMINEITRLIFPPIDDNVLTYKTEDNQIVEPKYYVPIIPTILLNEIRGIGMGWSTTIPAFNPNDLIRITKEYIETKKINSDIMSWHRYFKGNVEKTATGFKYDGIVKYDNKSNNKFIISELPIGMATNDLLKRLNFLMSGKNVDTEEFPKSVKYQPIYKVSDFKMLQTKNKNDIAISVTFADRMSIEDVKETLRLYSSISISNLTAFNRNCEIRQYTIEKMLSEFFSIRHNLYIKRKEYIINILNNEIIVLNNKFRFIKDIIDNTLVINKIPIKDVCAKLEELKYDKINDSYEYLYKLPVSKFTKEEYNKLKEKLESKNKEKAEMEKKTVADMWLKELDVLSKAIIHL
jgi:DNA topoisomerase-2